jgi:hypothetical protein
MLHKPSILPVSIIIKRLHITWPPPIITIRPPKCELGGLNFVLGQGPVCLNLDPRGRRRFIEPVVGAGLPYQRAKLATSSRRSLFSANGRQNRDCGYGRFLTLHKGIDPQDG